VPGDYRSENHASGMAHIAWAEAQAAIAQRRASDPEYNTKFRQRLVESGAQAHWDAGRRDRMDTYGLTLFDHDTDGRPLAIHDTGVCHYIPLTSKGMRLELPVGKVFPYKNVRVHLGFYDADVYSPGDGLGLHELPFVQVTPVMDDAILYDERFYVHVDGQRTSAKVLAFTRCARGLCFLSQEDVNLCLGMLQRQPRGKPETYVSVYLWEFPGFP
jgi:hypothetical protein